ncbi:MAG: hypothetical protein JRH11_20670 [Deltaproteobacteria bacterium]|nr:hypothetical protein [Deltaproteobacteria bacterium]
MTRASVVIRGANVGIIDKAGLVASVILILGITAAGSAAAQDPTTDPNQTRAADLETARGLALGGGARATAVSTSAVAYNPAGMALSRTYHIESQIHFEPASGRFAFGGGIADSSTNKLAMGTTFVGIMGNGETGYSGMDGRVAFALPLGDSFAIGISGRYLSLGREGKAPPGTDQDAPVSQGFTMDGSFALAINVIRIAGIAQNFIEVGGLLAPRRFGGGIGLVIGESFTISGDLLADIDSFPNPEVITGGGLEFLAGGVVPLRAGYRYDSGRGAHAITAGLGYTDANFGIETALRQDVGNTDDTSIMIGLRYFVQ